MKDDSKYINNFSEYEKALQFLEKGCECGCSAKLPKEKFAKRRADFQSLSKPEQDATLMGQLLIMEEGETTTSSRFPKRERTNQRFFYRWNNITPICQETYFNMLGISLKYFENVKSHLLDKGLISRVHGNTGKIPIRETKMLIDESIREKISSFLDKFAKNYGFPNPGKIKRANKTAIFLPTDMTYKSVYDDFLNSIEVDNNIKASKISLLL